MHFRTSFYTGVLLCLSLCFSCDRKKEDPVPPYKFTQISEKDVIYLDQIFPELDRTSSILYDTDMGYYFHLDQKEWSRSWSLGPVYIPSQSCDFSFKARRVDIPEFEGWYADDLQYVLLEDVRLPENVSRLEWGQCQSVVKLTLSLDEHFPYRKATLTDVAIHFPSSFRSEADGEMYESIPELEVTAEGTVVTFQLHSVFEPDEFVDATGRRCYSFETTVSAYVNVSPEDAIGPVPETPAEMKIQGLLEFERIDFTQVSVDFESLSLSPETVTWDPVPVPSFLSGEGTNVRFLQPRLLLEYHSDLPFAPTIGITACHGDKKASFELDGTGKNLYFAHSDHTYREGINNQEVNELENLFGIPSPDGVLRPSIIFRPPVSVKSAILVPEKEYTMHATAEWMLPLAYTGTLDVATVSTPPYKLDGITLGAAANYTHRIRQFFGSYLPFDCRVTPVFTMEGEAPVYLDEFTLGKDSRGHEFSYRFIPAKDDWRATLHFILTPTVGWDEYFIKERFMDITDSRFSANLEEDR